MSELSAPAAARHAGLRYVSDESPGIRRLGRAPRFRYVSARGKPIRSPQILGRIRALAIPPAWTEVWICPDPEGHIQACGRDARRRKQYRYHPRWREVRDENKFDRMIAFGQALPKLRRRVAHDLALPGLPRDKVLATVVRILESTGIRVGNSEYARENGHFGLTTLRTRHVDRHGPRLHFEFPGKGGKRRVIELEDPRVAKIVGRCQSLPGQELFQYVDEAGERHRVSSEDVNEYLRAVTNEDFSAKDCRTWLATRLMLHALSGETRASKRVILGAVDQVAEILGNTRTVCRASYIHPAVIDCSSRAELPKKCANVRAEERALLRLLRSERRRSARK
jgi:DNA topoisomerase I